jgi:hypothetical protein
VPQQPPPPSTLLWRRRSSASSPKAQLLWRDIRRKAHDEQQSEGVPAIRGRSPHSRGVRAIGVVGGAQLSAPIALLRHPDPLMTAAFAAKERSAGIDRIQELLPRLSRQPLLRLGSAERPLCLAVRTPAQCAAAAGVPARRCAVPRLSHRPYRSGGSPITGHFLLTTQALCRHLGKLRLPRDKTSAPAERTR